MSTVRALVCVSILAALLAVPEPASAQLKGHYVPGFTGLNNGSQGPPALTIVFPIYFYTTDTLKDDDGDELGTHPRINATFFGPGLLRVTNVKLLGGNLGGQILPIAFMKERLEGPSLDVRSGRPRLATLEIHSDKKDSGIKVGNILTFEGGLGPELLQEGGRHANSVYYYHRSYLLHAGQGQRRQRPARSRATARQERSRLRHWRRRQRVPAETEAAPRPALRRGVWCDQSHPGSHLHLTLAYQAKSLVRLPPP